MKSQIEEPDQINSWRLKGGIIILLLGAAWHFLYDITGHSNVAAFIAPVNESVWEHLKMGYWPMILYSIFEYRAVKGKVSNYFPGKLASIVTLNSTIVMIFYCYTHFTEHSILWVDIASFIFGIFAGQIILKFIFHLPTYSEKIQLLSCLVFGFIGILFAILTHFPPHWPIFMDHMTHSYGITG